MTTLLKTLSKDGIQAWRDRVGEAAANKKSRDASRRGDNLHKVCEKYLLNGTVDITSEVDMTRKMFKQVHPILDKHVTAIKGVEYPLYSHLLRTAGTADLICLWDGELAIVDFKTSIKKKLEKYLIGYCYQSTAYAIMMNEMFGALPKKFVLIFGLEEDNKPDIVEKNVSKYVTNVVEFFNTVERP